MNRFRNICFLIKRALGHKKRFVFHIYANRANVGDWLSAIAICDLLKPRNRIELLCDKKYIKHTLAVLRHATPDDLIVVGGGGLIKDTFTPLWKGLKDLDPSIPLVLWGIGACVHKQNGNPLPIDAVDAVIRRARVVSLRDNLSRSFFPALKPTSAIPCPALVTVISQQNRQKAINQTAQQQPKGVLLHVIHDKLISGVTLKQMTSAAKDLASRCGLHYHEIDNRIPAGNEQALKQLLAQYAHSSIVLSTRLHGCILGLGAGCKVVAVSGDYKIESFMEAAGLGDWVIDAQQPDLIGERLERVTEQPAPQGFFNYAIQGNLKIADQVRRIAPRLFYI